MFLSITNSIFDLVNYSKNIYKNTKLFFGYGKPYATYFIYAFVKVLESESEDDFEKVDEQILEENIDEELSNILNNKEQLYNELEKENENETGDKSETDEKTKITDKSNLDHLSKKKYKYEKKLINVTYNINDVLNLKFENNHNLIHIEEYVTIDGTNYLFVHKPVHNNKDFHLSLMITQFFKNNYEYVLNKIKSNTDFILATITETDTTEFEDSMEDVEPLIYYSQLYPTLFNVCLNDLGEDLSSIEFLLKNGETKTFTNEELILF